MAVAADAAALVRGDTVVASASPRGIGLPEPALAAAAAGDGGQMQVSGAGAVVVAVAPVQASPPVKLVVARCGTRAFTSEDHGLLRSIAPVLAFGLRNGDRSAEETLHKSELRLRRILEAADEAFVSCDAEGLILEWNASAEAIFGWSRAEALGHGLTDTIAPRDPRTGEDYSLEELLAINEGQAPNARVALCVRHRAGRDFPAELTISRLRAGDGHIIQAFIRDRTDQRQAERGRQQAEEQLVHQALHDSLTGLPNRTLLLDRLGHATALAERRGSSVAVLIADVDNLTVVNESLGHAVGDELLVAVAQRLAQGLRASDTVARPATNTLARMGGGEFAIVCEGIDDGPDATAIAERIADEIAPPFEIGGERLFVTVSIGIAVGTGGASPQSLIRDADIALHHAKKHARGRYELFDSAMRAGVLDRIHAENVLREAIERNQLRLVYQPIVSVADGGLVGVEALVRWQHPDRGQLSPAEFLPLAEESGLIVPLGRWVLEQACDQAVAWRDSGDEAAPVRVSVNVSGHQLVGGGIVELVTDLLARTGLEPARLMVEVTETVLLTEMETPVTALRQLRALGVRILLDDFGTGYSSLNYLRRLPVDAVKLDRSFVSRLDEAGPDRQIVAAVVQLVRALQMTAIAEGVETEEQLEWLRKLGCHFAQGYHFARPMAPEQLDSWLRGVPPSSPVPSAPTHASGLT